MRRKFAGFSGKKDSSDGNETKFVPLSDLNADDDDDIDLLDEVTPAKNVTPELSSDLVSENAEPAPEEKEAEMLSALSDLTTSISCNTIIKGDISTQDNIEVFGRVEGDLKSEAVIKISGRVIGDINCVTLIATGANIVGNIKCSQSVVIGADTHYEGNIFTDNAVLIGQMLGNLKAAGSTTISEQAILIGDLTTSMLEVSKGATIHGAVVMESAPAPEPEPEPTPEPAPKNGKDTSKHNKNQPAFSPPIPEPTPVSSEDAITSEMQTPPVEVPYSMS